MGFSGLDVAEGCSRFRRQFFRRFWGALLLMSGGLSAASMRGWAEGFSAFSLRTATSPVNRWQVSPCGASLPDSKAAAPSLNLKARWHQLPLFSRAAGFAFFKLSETG
jgi:hypothetical protein